MSTTPLSDFNQLLEEWNHGDKTALDKLIPLVYGELRRIAHHYMIREHPGHSLQSSALINEAYIRLAGVKKMHWQNRSHFLAVAARLMRQILVDYARSRHYAKRGGGALRVSLDGVAEVSTETPLEVIAVDHALRELETLDLRKGQIVELRYFGGLNIEETAAALEISPTTVEREWREAKAWLYRALRQEHVIREK
ncbi:MAG: sigma-70 family RNA polymerase sigma factor [Terriglobia bacterium]|jgi:RNA polymerase sigma-70 factor (ECF subfamily)